MVDVLPVNEKTKGADLLKKGVSSENKSTQPVDPQASRIKGVDVLDSLNKIQINLVIYLNSLNKNALNIFQHVKKEIQQQDARIAQVAQEITDLRKFSKDLSDKFRRTEIRLRNIELTSKKTTFSAMDNIKPSTIAALTAILTKMLMGNKEEKKKEEPKEESEKDIIPQDGRLKCADFSFEAMQDICLIAKNELKLESQKLTLTAEEIVLDATIIETGKDDKITKEQTAGHFDPATNTFVLDKIPVTPPSVGNSQQDPTTQLGENTVGQHIYTFDEATSNSTFMQQWGITKKDFEPSIPGAFLRGKSFMPTTKRPTGIIFYNDTNNDNKPEMEQTVQHEEGHIGRAKVEEDLTNSGNIFKRYMASHQYAKKLGMTPYQYEEGQQRMLDLSV